jgi:ribosomal protein L11 methylase PrmA
MSEKGKLVAEFVKRSAAKVVWDLGANTGVFSHIAAQYAKEVVSFDIDPAAVENHYLFLKNSDSHKSLPINTKILPLVLDLTNPTSDYGWAGSERQSVKSRANADLVMALALIHHLAISNNIPLERVAKYFRDLSSNLIIEFVPKSDSQVKKLLATREDIFPDYTIDGFEKAFTQFFDIIERKPVTGSERVLYLLQGKRLNSN